MGTCRFPPVLALFLALATAVSAQSFGERCFKRNQMGTCISIRQCPTLLALLDGPRPNLAALQQARCGFMGNVPIVCCPDNTQGPSNGGTTGGTTNTPGGSGPNSLFQDVSRHRNIGLLPMDTCGPVADLRIFGGNVTAVLEFPWMALLGYETQGGPVVYRCGGSLINDNYVLTAAHCVTHLSSRRLKLVTIRLGEHDLDKDPDCDSETKYCAPSPLNFGIEETIPHQQYTKKALKNDIALIRLRGRVNFGSSPVRAICLPVGPEHQNRNLDKESLIVAGWGTTENSSSSSVQLKVHVPVVSLQQCRPLYERVTQVGPTHICAGGVKGHDSCTGDSGGPLFFYGLVGEELKTVQFGVVSFGPRHCGTEGMPGVYTRIGAFMDWLLNQMKP